VIDRRPVLERWLPVLRQLRADGVDVYGFFNNHFAGHAPATIDLFTRLWNGEEPEEFIPPDAGREGPGGGPGAPPVEGELPF